MYYPNQFKKKSSKTEKKPKYDTNYLSFRNIIGLFSGIFLMQALYAGLKGPFGLCVVFLMLSAMCGWLAYKEKE